MHPVAMFRANEGLDCLHSLVKKTQKSLAQQGLALTSETEVDFHLKKTIYLAFFSFFFT